MKDQTPQINVANNKQCVVLYYNFSLRSVFPILNLYVWLYPQAGFLKVLTTRAANVTNNMQCVVIITIFNFSLRN